MDEQNPISDVRAVDLPQVRTLIELAVRCSVAETEADAEFLIADINETLDQWLSEPEDSVHLKYEVGGEILGVALVKKFWNLSNLFVAPSRQRHGIHFAGGNRGIPMRQLAIAVCKNQGCRTPFILVRSNVPLDDARALGDLAADNEFTCPVCKSGAVMLGGEYHVARTANAVSSVILDADERFLDSALTLAQAGASGSVSVEELRAKALRKSHLLKPLLDAMPTTQGELHSFCVALCDIITAIRATACDSPAAGSQPGPSARL